MDLDLGGVVFRLSRGLNLVQANLDLRDGLLRVGGDKPNKDYEFLTNELVYRG